MSLRPSDFLTLPHPRRAVNVNKQAEREREGAGGNLDQNKTELPNLKLFLRYVLMFGDVFYVVFFIIIMIIMNA